MRIYKKIAESIYSTTITMNVFFKKKQKELIKSLTISFNKPYTERIAVIIDVTQKQRIQNSYQKKDRYKLRKLNRDKVMT